MKSIKKSRHRIRDKENMPFSPVNKKLNFSFELDSSDLAPPPRENISMAMGAMGMGDHENKYHVQFDLEMDKACDDFLSNPLTFGLPVDSQSQKPGVDNDLENFSPCRTRSGRVYESVEKKKRRLRGPKRPRKTPRTRFESGQSGAGSLADCSEEESDDDNDASEDLGGIAELQSAMNQELNNSYNDRLDNFPSLDLDCEMSSRLEEGPALYPPPLDYLEGAGAYPPPLNHTKHPVSRFSEARCRAHHGIPSSPISSLYMMDDSSPLKHTNKCWPLLPGGDMPSSPLQSPSPPTNAVRAMRIFDMMSSPNSACAISSPRSTPRTVLHKARLLFDEDDDEHRRASAPADPTLVDRVLSDIVNSTTNSSEKVKSANVNPFTPSAMMAATKKRCRSKRSINSPDSPLSAASQEDLQHSLDSLSGDESDEESGRDEMGPLPSKRVRVSDISITRYEKEFLEVGEIASGEFGTVKKARHRLDGIVYAIKVTKNVVRVNSRDERVAMNEVFAHAALMKHKHVVRYYNSWCENSQVYIQNEYCEGGSLASQIEDFRQSRRFFTETELKKMVVNVAKGLQYIHSKQLVHLDIKPENIFISLDNYIPSPPRRSEHSTDSGAASGDHFDRSVRQTYDHGAGDETDNSEMNPGDSGNDRVHYKIGDLGHVAPIFGGEMSPEEGDCRYMAPEFLEMEVDRSRLTKADIFSLGLTVFEAACLRPLPKNSLDDPNYENIKRGDLPYMDRYSKDFNNLVKSLVNPDPISRPSANKLLANCILNPGMNKTRSQLYKELKETREKLLLLEQQVSQVEVKTKTKQQLTGGKRLVGRGTVKSMSCLM